MGKLNIRRLQGLLEHEKIDLVVIHNDLFDYITMELSSVKRPGMVGHLHYENSGWEPRLLSLTISPATVPIQETSPADHTLRMSGNKDDDAGKIFEFVLATFLSNG